MDQKIIESRKLIDQVIEIIEKIVDINESITDDEFKTEFIMSIGQHRHTFEEQGVTDHSNCMISHCANGTHEGICGLLLHFAHYNPDFKKAFLEAAEMLKRFPNPINFDSPQTN